MTMVPAQTQQQQQEKHHLLYGGYGGCGGGGGYADNLMNRFEGYECCILGSDNPMAEDESRTNSLNEAAGSSSKDNNNNNENSINNIQEERDGDEGWLKLSIGALTEARTSRKNNDHQGEDPTVRRGGLMELDLLPGSSSCNQARLLSAPVFQVPSDQFRGPARPVMSTSLFFQQQGSSSSSAYPHQEINWAFRPMPHNIAAAAASSSSSSNSQSSSSSLMPLMGSYFSRPFHVVHSGIDVAGPSSDFRVIDPPRRPISGIWFTLQASPNQAREPFLPQISKCYLRIKDGRMTVRLLMKYLVNKLRLDSESEVEITCRGQQLLPFLTLQHVRDNIWSPRDAVTLLPHSSTTDHVMVLHYARTAQK